MKLRPTLSVAIGALLALAGVAQAQTHRWVDDQGRVHYSNLHPLTHTPAPPERPEPAKRPANPKRLVEEVLEASGVKRQIGQIQAVMQNQVARRRTDMKPGDYATLTQIIADSYRAEEMYQGVRERFNNRFEEQHLRAVLQSFGSPLFRKISEFNAQASRPEAARRIQQFAEELRRQPPSQDRMALIRGLDDATGATEFNLEVTIATVRGIALAVDPMLPPEKRLKGGQLEQSLSQTRSGLRASLNDQVTVTLLYTYRLIPDGDLRQYLAFLESDAGRWFSRMFREGLLAAMTAAAENAGKRMGKTLAAARPSGLEAQKNWALAASAILTERNRQRHDLLGGSERTEANIRQWKQIMSQWDINSRADLFQTLKWLEEGGQRQDFEQLGTLLESLTGAKHQELRTRMENNPETARKLHMVEKHYRTLGRKGLLGWDLSHYISLCRWGYLVGYLSEEEAWKRIMPAAQALQRAFDSWKDLGENYLIGREFWSLPQTQETWQVDREAYQKLLDDPGSPWRRYPWSLNLDTGRADTARALRAY